MRYMILRTSSKEEGGVGGYEVSPRVFASLDEAEKYRAGISPSRSPVTVAIVRPTDGEDVWYNEHGAEFLFLYEYDSPPMGRCVWLLDEDGIEVGIPKEGFVKHFHQHEPCSNCDGTGAANGGHWKCSTCDGSGHVPKEAT